MCDRSALGVDTGGLVELFGQIVLDADLADGASTVEDVQERCGAATRCGGCRPAIEMLVATAVEPVGALA